MDQTPIMSDTVRNGRPWWQMCCGGCLLLVIAVIVGGCILMRVFAGPGIRQLSALPPNYPKEAISPLRLNEAQSITYLEGGSKSKMLNTVYAPLKLFAKLTGQHAPDSQLLQNTAQSIDALGTDAQNIDTVTITWKNLKASREEVLGYYTDQFKQAAMTMSVSHDDTEQSDALTGIREGLFAQLSTQSSTSSRSIEDAELVVSYSNKK